MKETEKIFAAFDDYIKDKDLNELELEDELKEFIKKLNNNDIELNDRIESMDMMDLAYEAETEKEAKKYAKKALALDPNNLDAKLFMIDFEPNITKFEKKLDELVEEEELRLKEQGIYKDDNIGSFYGIVETRPYMRSLFKKMNVKTQAGKYGKAIEICEEMLRLNENDNMGVRYSLMSLYALYENEEKIIKLVDKFNEKSCLMLLPLAILWYKKEKYENLDVTLKSLHESNRYIIKNIRKNIEEDDTDIEERSRYYQHGAEDEANLAILDNTLLMISTPGFLHYAYCWKYKK